MERASSTQTTARAARRAIAGELRCLRYVRVSARTSVYGMGFGKQIAQGHLNQSVSPPYSSFFSFSRLLAVLAPFASSHTSHRLH